MTAMKIKPIFDVQHCGKRVRVEFAPVQRGIGMISMGDVGHFAAAELVFGCAKSVSAHHH